jgi:hypothetical protein
MIDGSARSAVDPICIEENASEDMTWEGEELLLIEFGLIAGPEKLLYGTARKIKRTLKFSAAHSKHADNFLPDRVYMPALNHANKHRPSDRATSTKTIGAGLDALIARPWETARAGQGKATKAE